MSPVNEKLRRSTLLLLSCYASLSLFILALSFWWSVSSVLRSPKRKKFSYIIFMSQSIEVYIACLSMRFRTVAGESLSLRELVSVLAVCNVIRSFNAKWLIQMTHVKFGSTRSFTLYESPYRTQRTQIRKKSFRRRRSILLSRFLLKVRDFFGRCSYWVTLTFLFCLSKPRFRIFVDSFFNAFVLSQKRDFCCCQFFISKLDYDLSRYFMRPWC